MDELVVTSGAKDYEGSPRLEFNRRWNVHTYLRIPPWADCSMHIAEICVPEGNRLRRNLMIAYFSAGAPFSTNGRTAGQRNASSALRLLFLRCSQYFLTRLMIDGVQEGTIGLAEYISWHANIKGHIACSKDRKKNFICRCYLYC